MSDITKRAEDRYQIPCGPLQISANGVCRRSLKDSIDSLLDRLTLEVNPVQDSLNNNKSLERAEDGSILQKSEDKEARKKKLIEEGKLRAEVSHEVRKFREQLQGNSKFLQDTSGKIEPW